MGSALTRQQGKQNLKVTFPKGGSGLHWTVRLILCVHEAHCSQPDYKLSLSLSEVQTFTVEASKYLPWLQKAALSFLEGSGL